MSPKTWIWIGVFIGSTVGSSVPLIWGAGFFSFSSVIWGSVGSVLGIWAGYKIAQMF